MDLDERLECQARLVFERIWPATGCRRRLIEIVVRQIGPSSILNGLSPKRRSQNANPHHLISTAHEFVRDGLDGCVATVVSHRLHHDRDMRRRLGAECEQREDSDLARDADELADRSDMEVRIQLASVQKQEMGADGEIERCVRESCRGQFSSDVTALLFSRFVVLEESVHRGSPHPREILDRSDRVPDEFIRVLSRLFDHFIERRVDPLPDLVSLMPIQRIARDDARAEPRRLGVEARRTVGTTENWRLQVSAAQREHPAILVE
ncbi:MAG TPA: hypothetical protein VGQ16_06555 [Vicinamibacterales bacterium]|nr:hypothetical protein [Vicinamibacterales bacterium]